MRIDFIIIEAILFITDVQCFPYFIEHIVFILNKTAFNDKTDQITQIIQNSLRAVILHVKAVADDFFTQALP